MAKGREIKSRIVSVKKTQQITRAMKMIAGVKYRKAEQRLHQLRPYAQLLDEVIHSVVKRNAFLEDMFYRKKHFSKGRDLVVVLGGDRGLCGNFNGTIVRKCLEISAERPCEFVLIGKKIKTSLEKKNITIKAHYDSDLSKHPQDFLMTLSAQMLAWYEQYDRVWVVYTEYISAVRRHVKMRQLLPVEETTSAQESSVQIDYMYERSEADVLDWLTQAYIKSLLRCWMAESVVSEESARMTAMDSATNNAGDMLRRLTLSYNRARQAGITTEIIEISSGAEAFRA